MVRATVLLMALMLVGHTGYSASFEEQPVTFKSEDEITLAGTLTTPIANLITSKFPAVLLIAGSGPTDRDGNQPPQITSDLLKQIAQELARNGIASFRFDKRAAHVNRSQWPADQGLFPSYFSLQNHQADVRAAFRVILNAQQVDRQRVGIVGHSEGGMLALSQVEELVPKALVLIGTPGRSYGAILSEQIGALLDQQGASAATKAYYLTKNAEAQKAIVEGGEVPLDIPIGLKAFYPASARIFLRDILNLEPTKFAKSYTGMVLIMNGELDRQVSPVRDANALAAAFKECGPSSQCLDILPSDSHNLKKITSPNDPGIEGPVDPKALADLAHWLSKNL